MKRVIPFLLIALVTGCQLSADYKARQNEKWGEEMLATNQADLGTNAQSRDGSATLLPPLPPVQAPMQSSLHAQGMITNSVMSRPRSVTLAADEPVQVLRSTDLRTWQVFTNVSTNGVTLTADQGREFFRGVRTNALVLVTWNDSPDPEVTGYRIYAGNQSRLYTVMTDVGDVNWALVSVPAWPAVYLTATAFDASGDESAFSNEAIYRPPVPVLTLQ